LSFFFRPQMHVISSEARNLFMNLPLHIIKKYSAVTMFYFELPPTIISKMVAVTLLIGQNVGRQKCFFE
ncbi:MAG: hypothetical protein IKI25_00685, partial [Bacteroidales bacterium]|nr:hypothetical protein [Bacteroidales bacterium]